MSGSMPFAWIERPEGVPAEYHEYARLMFDMIALAYQANLTRVYRKLGIRSRAELGASMAGVQRDAQT